MMSRRGL